MGPRGWRKTNLGEFVDVFCYFTFFENLHFEFPVGDRHALLPTGRKGREGKASLLPQGYKTLVTFGVA